MRMLATLAIFAMVGPSVAGAVDLIPHRAIYDLELRPGTATELSGIDGRIAVEMTHETCETYQLEYRFMAQYASEETFTLVDQQIRLNETLNGSKLEFSNLSTVDGLEDQASAGTASSAGGTTTIDYDDPSERMVEIPRASFPIGHTRNLIEAAEKGAFIHEAKIFDGDVEGEKETRSTSIIAPMPKLSGKETDSALPEEASILRGLDRWRISEAYYDNTAKTDAEPDFTTSYTLYENGVSDDLIMTFDGYSLSGAMSEFTPLETTDCSSRPAEN